MTCVIAEIIFIHTKDKRTGDNWANQRTEIKQQTVILINVWVTDLYRVKNPAVVICLKCLNSVPNIHFNYYTE